MQEPSSTADLELERTDPFLKDLRARVAAYFDNSGLRPRDCPRMYLKTAIVFAWFIASYVLLVFFTPNWWSASLASVSLALAMAGIGFNVQHDGSHRAYSNRMWINKLTAMSMDLMGASSFHWARKHNTFHHTYTNISGDDDDISLGPLGRLSPHQKRHAYHRYQHYYLWFFYGFITMKWQLADDFYNWAAGKVGSHRIPRPRGRDLAIFLGGKAVSISVALVLPSFFHPFWLVLVFYVSTQWVAGIVLSIVFQLAHVVEEADFPSPGHAREDLRKNWAAHQLRTTVNFAPNNPILTWYLGGLNYQVEHHLFPRVCHVHYPKLSRLVAQACREHGVPHQAHQTMRASLASHFRWLRRMGQAVPQQ
jgi:linoleoyl-CoA desaturase